MTRRPTAGPPLGPEVSTEPSRQSLALDAFTEAGRIVQSTSLLRRALDAGHAGVTFGENRGRKPDTTSPDPKAASRHYQRGLQLLRLQRTGDAIEVLQQAVRLDKANAAAHHALGAALLREGQLAAAVTSLKQAVAHKPDLAVAYRDLGSALERQGFDLEAIEAYQRALALSPKLAGVHRRLGALHEARGHIDQAIKCYRSIVAPETTEGRIWRAWSFTLERDIDSAERLLRKAIALEPQNSDAHHALAGLLVSQGRLNEGAERFETALRLNRGAFLSWLGLVQTKRFTEADRPTVERLRAELGNQNLHDAAQMTLHFALGKVFDDLGNYAGAIQHFDAAHAVLSQSTKLNRDELSTWVNRLIARFTPEMFAQRTEFGTPDELPLLIIGMPRSGTTLVEQIMTSHPAIAAGDELPFWVPYAEWSAEGLGFTAQAAHEVAASYIALLRTIGPSAARVTDKLPFNFRRLGLIHLLFPNARIIHCRRNPIDTCLSIYATQFRAKLDFIGSKGDLAFFYQQYARLMQHWRGVLPADRFLEIDYERLISDREAETKRMIAFTGLDWDDACLRPEGNARTIKTASAWQARQPVYATSVEKWRRYEPWLGELGQLVPT